MTNCNKVSEDPHTRLIYFSNFWYEASAFLANLIEVVISISFGAAELLEKQKDRGCLANLGEKPKGLGWVVIASTSLLINNATILFIEEVHVEL